MSWQRPQKTVKYVMAPYTEGGRYKNVPVLSSHTDASVPTIDQARIGFQPLKLHELKAIFWQHSLSDLKVGPLKDPMRNCQIGST